MQAEVDALLVKAGAALESVGAARVGFVLGSRATGRPRPDSDLAVAALCDPRLDAEGRETVRRDVLAALTNTLGQLGGLADVLDLRCSGSAVAFRVVRDGRCVRARKRGERVRLEALIARRYDDEAPRRELIRGAAARAAGPMGVALPGRS